MLSELGYCRLSQLGPSFLMELTLADDQHELGIEGTYELFRDELFQQMWKVDLYPVTYGRNVL